jgi:hypothetical protein
MQAFRRRSRCNGSSGSSTPAEYFAWPFPDRNRQPNKMFAVEPPPIIVKKSGPNKRKGLPEGPQGLVGYRLDHPEKKLYRET